jgi:hypothetical protein
VVQGVGLVDFDGGLNEFWNRFSLLLLTHVNRTFRRLRLTQEKKTRQMRLLSAAFDPLAGIVEDKVIPILKICQENSLLCLMDRCQILQVNPTRRV